MSDKPHSSCPSGANAFDPATLRRLLALAGAEAAPLLRQFIADLRSERDRLRAGIAGPDIPGLRRAAHGIIALAGTAGDDALAEVARALHATTTGEADPQSAPDLAQRALAGVEALMRAIAAEGVRLGLAGPPR